MESSADLLVHENIRSIPSSCKSFLLFPASCTILVVQPLNQVIIKMNKLSSYLKIEKFMLVWNEKITRNDENAGYRNNIFYRSSAKLNAVVSFKTSFVVLFKRSLTIFKIFLRIT